MSVHRLKTWPEYFQALCSGRKTFELRKNDRDFRVGDVLLLEEWDPATKAYSGRLIEREVTYIAQGVFGLPADVCVMAVG